jgi:uncharacterized membrane protein
MLGYDWPRLHAALNDLPTALLLAAVIFDILAASTKRASFRSAAYWTLMVGAVGGVAAVLSGLQAENHIQHGEAVHEVMETHEKLALVTLGIFALLAVWRLLRENKMGSGERRFALVVSLGGLGALLATAVLGGKLVFEHAAGIKTAVLQAETLDRAEDHHHPGGEGEYADSIPKAGHTHPPGTPPHKD